MPAMRLVLSAFAIASFSAITGYSAEAILWRRATIDPEKVATDLVGRFGLTQPEAWARKTPSEKLTWIASEMHLPTPPLFSSPADIIQTCVSALSPLPAAAGAGVDELAASVVIPSLVPPLDSGEIPADALVGLLREFRNTPSSMVFYAALRNRVLRSDDEKEGQLFVEKFIGTPDAAAVQAHLLQLADAKATAEKDAGRYKESFRIYANFIKLNKTTAPALAGFAAEKLENAILEWIVKVVDAPGVQMTSEERVAACDNFLKTFPTSTARFHRVSEIAMKHQESIWERKRQEIQSGDIDATNKIKIIINSLGGDANTDYIQLNRRADDGEPYADCVVRINRVRDYLGRLGDRLEVQFPANLQLRVDAGDCVTSNQNLLNAADIAAKLRTVIKELEEQTKLLKGIDANLASMKVELEKMRAEMGAGFDRVDASLRSVNSNLVMLNATAAQTKEVMIKGFMDVNSHLDETNLALKRVNDGIQETARSLEALGTDVTSGFADLKKTINEVAAKDMTSTSFWGAIKDEASGAFDHATETVEGWF